MARTKQGMKEARIKRQMEEQEDNDDAPSCKFGYRLVAS
jgi:hypothetical protein